MLRSRKVIAAVCIWAFASGAQAASCDDLRDAGDTLTWAIPVSAMALTAFKRDKRGGGQLAKTVVYTGAGAGMFKQIGDKTRPEARESRQSFVSGHSAGAFMGASYLYTRYGKGWGVPAYGLAILTAYSRVCAQKHFADDVLGGALVAMMSNWYATSPLDDSGRIYPSFTSNGLELSWRTFFGGNRHPVDPPNFEPRYRMVFEFGPVEQDYNWIQTPRDDGTLFNLADLETEFHMTARLIIERYLSDKHELTVWYGPMGMTDFGDPTEPFNVGGVIFDPNDPDAALFDSNYRWWDLRAGYRYNIVNNDRWTARVGLSLQFTRTEITVEQRNLEEEIVKSAHAEESSVDPLLHGSFEFRLTDRWSIDAQIDGLALNDEHYWNSAVYLRFRPTQLWDLAIGSRRIDGKIDSGSLFNDVRTTDLTLQIGRSF